MSGGWERLEGVVRSADLDEGLAARIADPLWMLARQRQTGEFRGDDAASPAAVAIEGRYARLATLRPGRDGAVTPLSPADPLEAAVEATAEPDLGSAGCYASARAGRRLARMLREQDAAAAIDALRARFALPAPSSMPDLGVNAQAAVELLAHWALDGARIASTADTEVLAAVAGALDAPAQDRFSHVLAAWRAWYLRCGPAAAPSSWDDERLEYSFSIGVAVADGEVVLAAPEHPGGELDWYSCDLDADEAASHGLAAAPMTGLAMAAVPTPIRYDGMPASRWWEFEDGAVNLGAIEAGPADLARLLVAEFGVIYSDNWFLVPVRVPVGTLTELTGIAVLDTFGGRTPVAATAWLDATHAGPVKPGADRYWRMFELAGDELRAGHRAPWLLITPGIAGCSDGPALERVAISRDEAANLVWGVEQSIEGPLGRAADRAQAWHITQGFVARPPAQPEHDTTTASSSTVAGESSAPWRYRLGGEAPPWWIPFLPERTDAARVRLRRARLETWALLEPSEMTGPRSLLLDPRKPRWLDEAEVPRGGITVERAWQLARWNDGTLRVWLQRRKLPGRGDRGSALRFDTIES